MNRDNPNAIEFSYYQGIEDYIIDLRQNLRYYTPWISQHDADTVTKDNAWEMIINDTKLASCLDLLATWSAGEYYHISTGDPRVDEVVRRGLSCISDFTHARKQIIYDAIIYGLGLQKIQWDKAHWRDYPGLTWEVPVALLEVNRQRLRIERDINDRRLKWWNIWTEEHNEYVKIKNRRDCPLYEGPLEQDYVWFFWERNEMNPYYRGSGEVLYKLIYIKDKVIKYWADLCERYSQPIAAFMINTNKGSFDDDAINGHKSFVQRTNELIDLYTKMAQGPAWILDKNSEAVQFHEHGSSGSRIIQEFVEYADLQINNNILGGELTSDAGSGHSYAMGQIHRGNAQSKVMYNRTRSQERYQDNLMCEFMWRNRANFSALGLTIPERYNVKIKFSVEEEEIKKEVLREDGGTGKRSKLLA